MGLFSQKKKQPLAAVTLRKRQAAEVFELQLRRIAFRGETGEGLAHENLTLVGDRLNPGSAAGVLSGEGGLFQDWIAKRAAALTSSKTM